MVHPGPVSPGGASEHPDRGVAPGLVHRQALGHLVDDPLPEIRGEDVLLVGLVQVGHQFHGIVQHVDQVGERVPEQAGDPHGHVYPRPAELLQRDGLESYNPVPVGRPHGTDAHQPQDVRHVVPVVLHGVRGPDDEPDLPRERPLLLLVLLDHLIGHADAHAPCRLRGDDVGIDAVEVASHRKDVRVPPGGGAGGSREHVPAVAGVHHVVHLVGHPREVRGEERADEIRGPPDRPLARRVPDGLQTGVPVVSEGLHPPDEVHRPAVDVVQEDAVQLPSRGPGGVVEQRIQVVSARFRYGFPQRWDVAVAQSRQGVHALLQQLPLGRLPDDVQSVADYGVLDVRDVVVDPPELLLEVLPRDVVRDVQLLQQLRFPGGLQDLPYHGGPLLPLGGPVLEDLLQRGVHGLQRIVRAGTRHGGAHVPYQDRFGPPLALYPLAGIVYHVRIDVRDPVEDQVGIAFPGQPDVPPRQPLQGAVGAHVDDRVRSEIVLQPSVEGEVLVLRGQHRVVVYGLHLLRPSPHRLVADVDVAVHYPRDHEPPVLGAYPSGRFAPAPLHLVPVELGQLIVGFTVLLHGDHVGRLLAHPLLGRPFQIVGDVPEDLLDQVLGRLGDVVHRVSEVPEPLQHVADALYGVQSGGVAYPPGIGTGLPHQDGDPPVLPGCAGHDRPRPDAGDQMGYPVGQGSQDLRGARAVLVAADRHGDDLPVHLRPHDVGVEVPLGQAGGPLLVIREMDGGGHRLEDGHVGQRVVEVLLVRRVHAGAVAGIPQLGEAGGHHEGVYAPPVGTHEVPVDYGDRALVLLLPAAGEDRDGVHPLGLDLADEGVDVRQVAVEPVPHREHHSDGRLRRVDAPQVLVQGDVRAQVGMVYPAGPGDVGLRDVALPRQHPVQPHDYRAVVVAPLGAAVPVEQLVILVGLPEQSPVEGGDLRVAGVDEDAPRDLVDDPLVLLEAEHPVRVGHDADEDEVGGLRPPDELAVEQGILIGIGAVDPEEVEIPILLRRERPACRDDDARIGALYGQVHHLHDGCIIQLVLIRVHVAHRSYVHRARSRTPPMGTSDNFDS